MRIAILAFPGAEQGPELSLALHRAELEVVHFSGKEPTEQWAVCDGYILISGEGQLAETNTLATLQSQSARGKPILGIGAAASILVNSGLVPGLEDGRAGLTLASSTAAASTVRIRLTTDYQYNAFTRYLTPQHLLTTEMRTATGHFVIPPGLLHELELQGLNVFCYCDAHGEILSKPAAHNIAALANKAGNVMAIIPHPEKTLDGDALFISLRDHLRSGYIASVAPLHYWPR